MRDLTLVAAVALALSAPVAAAQSSGTGGGTGTRINSPASNAPTAPAARGGAGFSNSSGVGGNRLPENRTNVDRSLAQPAPFAPGGAFSNDSGNSALGQSPGQTSAGTATGNSGAGLDVGSATLGTGEALGTAGIDGNAGVAGTAGSGVPFGTATVVPGAAGTDVNGQRSGNPSGNGAGSMQSSTTIIATPTLDRTVRQAQAREQRRRAAGDEPRIIGIAPNTERDLTDQLPDDRIIRY